MSWHTYRNQILKEGDIINVDVTTSVDGYHGDQSETVLIGEVEQARKVANVSKTSLDIGIETVKAGIPLGVVCGEIEDYVPLRMYVVEILLVTELLKNSMRTLKFHITELLQQVVLFGSRDDIYD